MSDLEQRITSLTAEGRHAEAAALATNAGEHLRAAKLYAEVWSWSEAMLAAEAAARPDLVYEYAIAAGDRARLAQALEGLLGHDELARAAAQLARDKGRSRDAGRLLESTGALSEAAEAYLEASEIFDAARCHEARGAYRDAGKLYEKRLREEPEDAEAALRLGRILASFGRYDHAAKALQRAEASDAHAVRALRLLVACFAAKRLDEAAAQCLERLRSAGERVPVTVSEFLEATYGDSDGLLALSDEGDRGQLIAGRYRVIRPLGAGATGRVLLAHDGFYDREVAVKVLTVGGGATGRDAYERFAREARVAAGIDHPNVVGVFEFNPDGPFLVMEYMAGGTLADRLTAAEGRLSLPVTRHVLMGILGALAAVHGRGVTHRDLKPANVFFGPTGDVKLGDFGVAHLTDLGATLTGAMMGTLAYMSPEQITGSTRPSAATDLYALGVLAHRMLTGDLPFRGPDFVTQHLNDTPPTVSAVSPALGDVYDELVATLLAKDPSSRPSSADEVRALVEALPWEDPEDDAIVAATVPIAEPAPAAPVDPEDEAEARFGEVSDGLVFDRLLQREVVVESIDAARAARLRELSAADHPYLQAVYEVDEDTGTAHLERPSGEALDGALTGEALAQVKQALGALHARGVVHGEITPESIRLGQHRAVLMLPSANASGSVEDDTAALDALG